MVTKQTHKVQENFSEIKESETTYWKGPPHIWQNQPRTSRNSLIKLLYFKERESCFGLSRKSNQLQEIRFFSTPVLYARKKWSNIFKVFKEKSQPKDFFKQLEV